ncbi:MAG TPA: DNA polymerase III subunit alpha, partial [Firmicutes bacterium]|nr:DNA polymerase III subunit alpha [Bacillota bacterium]
IEQMNFPHYFLIVQDFVNWAKKNNIPIGPGRGSAAGSLVSYLLGITMVDPIEYNLLFERFLNPDRIGLPDIDIDICYEQRGEVIDYLKQKYGYDHVSQIATVNKLGPKQALRDVGRVLDIPLSEIDRISKLVPDLVKTFDEAFKGEPKLRQVAQDKKYSELFDAAIAINGLARHTGVHAAGIVISKEKIFEKVPCSTGRNDEIVTQYDKDLIEKVGLVKWDLLGLKNLTVIDKCVKGIKENIDPEFNINNIDLNDKKTFEIYASGDATGIFQLDAAGSAGGIKDVSRKFKPDNINDIIALLAIYRPGPLQSGMVEDFINRKNGKKSIQFPHPLLEPILKETYGVIVYQEQVMQISNILAGYSLGEADLLRRAMGKKKPEVMAKQRKRFLEGTKEKGINEKKAKEVFDLMEFFAGYGFNKSHSAAYAILSYQTAFLKTHYPVYFMASLMSAEKKNENKIVEYVNDCRKMKIRVLPPDINFSDYEFVVVENDIRFGLNAVKNVGEKAIMEIVEERKRNGKYISLIDFLERINLSSINRKMLESLILCGALDSLKVYRSQMIQVLDMAIKEALKRNNEREIGQISLFASENGESTTEFDQDFIKFPNIEEMDEIQKLKHEKELIGLYIT